MLPTILRLQTVRSALGISRSTFYSLIKLGLWTKPVHIGPRMVGWPESEVTTLIKARIAGRSDSDIFLLVKDLETKREIED